MFIVRPIEKKDAEEFINIAFTAGIGMTSMPKNLKALKKKIQDSLKSFKNSESHFNRDAGTYLFVLEDLNTGEIGGTCGIIANTGHSSPLMFYRINHKEKHNAVGTKIKLTPFLEMITRKNHCSEICSLYLLKEFRHSGLGRLLSFSRFLFIAAFPERFKSKIFAEMRGYINDHGVSYFWDGIGQHFVDVSFKTVMDLRDKEILDLTQIPPLHPIYIELLPQIVQESLGKIHEKTKPAYEMLAEEGFKISEEFDIFDGGPKIEISTKKIRSIKTSIIAKIFEITNEALDTPAYIISNNRIDFRACLSCLEKNKNGIILPANIASALHVKIGDHIRYVLPHKEPLK